MRMIAALLVAGCLSGCVSSGSDSVDDFGSSVGSGFVRNGDTYGTNRRMDVYGGATAPVLPSIGTPGMGK